MRGAIRDMNLKTRFEREEAARAMVRQGAQPNIIAKTTGCNLLWVEQLVRKAGGRQIEYQVET